MKRHAGVASSAWNLWNGARASAERAILREMEAGVPELGITSPVWERSVVLASLARQRGITLLATDLLVAECADVHRVERSRSRTQLTAQCSDQQLTAAGRTGGIHELASRGDSD